ncbi:CCA tRNA nucleotidyltransferase [Candidatus Curtissbacteria bacterium]|nr:CCA tRNA nucleotidyltransferase [Candidatus Curtissbacteria bacterium]
MDVEPKIKNIIDKLSNAGFEVAVVGGAVRDILMGKKAEDWDLTTNAKPEEIIKLFPKSFYNNIFGTVGVSQKDGIGAVQITTYRSENGYSDLRHPDVVVWGKSLDEDLERRDFTINAIALKYDGVNIKVVDPLGGQEDISNKIIRAVGDPNIRFKEDALRLLRAIRIATVLGFKIEEKTKRAIVVNARLISKISGERIRDELFKIIDCENAAEGIFLLREVKLLNEILPELDVCFSVEQKSPKRHHIFDVGTHCVLSLKNCPSEDALTKFATLLHDVGKAKVAEVTGEGVRTFYNHEVVGGRQVKQIAERLNLSRPEREKLYKLVRYHQFSVNEDQTDKALRRFINNIGLENIENMMALRVGDRLGGGLQQPESWRLKLFRKRIGDVLKKPFTVRDLKVNGIDVMKELSIGPGPKVGEILQKLFDEVVEDKNKNNRALLLKRIKTLGKK